MGHTYIMLPGISEVELTGTPKIVDEGIGQFEYWGHIEHHHDYQPELEEIEWDQAGRSDADNHTIEAYVEVNFTELAEKIIDSHDWPEPNEPEPCD